MRHDLQQRHIVYILTLSLRWTIVISDKDLYWLQIEGLTNIYGAKNVRTKWHIYLINEIPYQRFSFLGINDVLVIGIKFVFFLCRTKENVLKGD